MDLSKIEESTSLGEVLSAVGMLQTMYSSENTEEMKVRGRLIRRKIPTLLNNQIKINFSYPIFDLKITGKDGVGRKSEIPWVRLHSHELSPRATAGWYVVFLFDARGEEVFLSLNQGSTKFIENSFVPRPQEEVTKRSHWARNTLNNLGFITRELSKSINLKARGSNLGPSYEASNIYSTAYRYSTMPEDEIIYKDVQDFLDLLSVLYYHEIHDYQIPADTSTQAKGIYSTNNAESTKRKVGSGQGFYITYEIRSLIEAYAMKAARENFENEGWTLQDCSGNKPFDYLCRRNGEEIFLEVKGTSSLGESIILTRNEVDHMSHNYPNTALFLMKEIEVVVTESGKKQCTGGKSKVIFPWRIHNDSLKVISYQYFF